MRSIPNLLLFRTSAPSIVLAALFGCIGVIAQTEVNGLQRVHTVNGIVRSKEKGKPIAGARGRIIRSEDSYVILEPKQPARTEPKSEYLFTTDENGKWSVNLANGAYVVTVNPDSTDPNQRSSDRFATKKQMITVAGASDVEHILIEVSKGARISGTVIVEGDLPLLSLSLYAGKVDAPIELTQGVSKKLTPTGQTTAFTMTEIPDGKIELNAFLSTDSHYIKSISAPGIDLLQEKLNLISGAEVKDVRIVVASDLAVFTGRIVSENGGTTLPRMSILLNWVGTRRMLGGRMTGRTDEQGGFLLRPPPGDYTIHVFHDRSGVVLSAVKSLPLVTFKPGEQKDMEIRVP